MKKARLASTWQRWMEPTLAWLLMTAGAMVWLMPWRPVVSSNTDYAWTLALQVAHQQGLQFGREIIFTYGPWAFVEVATYHPSTRLTALVTSVVLILAWSGSIWLACGRWLAGNVWVRAAALALCVALSLPLNPWFGIVLTTCFLMAMSWDARRVRFALAPASQPDMSAVRLRRLRLLRHQQMSALAGWGVLLVVAGLLAHMKHPYLVALTGVVGAMTLQAATARRWAVMLAAPAVYLSSWLVFWLLAGQSMQGLGDHLVSIRHILATYGDAMSYPGKSSHVWVFLGCVALVLALAIGCTRGQALIRLWKTLAAAGLLFILFKSAITRQLPEHYAIVIGPLLTMTLACWVHLWSQPGRRWQPRVAGSLAGATVVGLLLCISSNPHQRLRAAVDPGRAEQVADFLLHGDKTVKEQWASGVQITKDLLNVGPIELTTDQYLTRLDIPIKLGVPMSFRPTLQSYIAADDYLLRRNAQHLESSRAPQRILLTKEYRQNDYYWSFFDSLSWPLLLTRYDVVGDVGSHVVLAPALQSRQYAFGPTQTQRLMLHEWNDLPAIPPGANGLWARIHLQPTLLGQAGGVLYKRPAMEMDLLTEENRVLTYRFAPGVARAGFLLAPTIEFDRSWVYFAMNDPKQPRILWDQVTRIRLRPKDEASYWPAYENEVTAEFEGFSFTPQPRPSQPAPQQAE